MIRVAIIGKGDILEKVMWCKKFAGSTDELDRNRNARLEIKTASDLMLNLTDPTLDTVKVKPKLDPFKLKFPATDELDLLTGRLIKDIGIYALFSEFERVPGRPDYEFGIGLMVETYNIFFEDKIHEQVEVVQVKKKMGLFTEKQTSKEKKIKSITSLFGDQFAGEQNRVAVIGKEKDNRDNLRYGIRVLSNVNILNLNGQQTYVPDELKLQFKDDAGFLGSLAKAAQMIETVLNRLFVIVGYESSPDYTILLGDADLKRKIGGFSKEEVSGTTIIETDYE